MFFCCVGDDVKYAYEHATAPPIPSPPPTPQPKRTRADWERDERELAEERTNREKLRKHDVPPYFDSELGKAFLLTQVGVRVAQDRCGQLICTNAVVVHGLCKHTYVS